MDLKDVRYERSGHIATITLDRPDRMNSLGGSLGADLQAAIREAEGDSEVWAVIVTGAGRAFCAGHDTKEPPPGAAGGESAPVASRLRGPGLARLLWDARKPYVAAIHGPAVGFGFELAMLCDYRIGSTEARMGGLHVKNGIVPESASVVILPRLIGWANASKVHFTGEIFGAQELLEMGVLNEIVPPEQLQQAARAYAERIAANAPLAVQMTKRLMRMADPVELDAVVDYAMLLTATLQATEDSHEGARAIAEKRRPEFKGR